MSEISDFLDDFGAAFSVLSKEDSQEFERRWLETFARNVKAHHGKWIYRGLRWHGFSYNLQPYDRRGLRAIDTYLAQWPAEYVVFDEDLQEALRCRSERYPDLSPLVQDIYVSHANLKWTMVFTHEQPDIGPYFATRDA